MFFRLPADREILARQPARQFAHGERPRSATDRTWTLSPAYDLNPNVAKVLIALTWLGSPEIPTRFEQLARLAEIGGIPARTARTIYEEVEAATHRIPSNSGTNGSRRK